MSLHGMKRVSQKRVGVDLMQVYQKVGEREGGGNGLKRILPKDTVTEVVVRSYFKEQEERG